MHDIYSYLKNLGVIYKRFDHEAVFTNDESEKLGIGTSAQNTKNLFLSDEKEQRFYLLTIQHGKKADLKKFSAEVGQRRLRFANPYMLETLLGLTPGSVTPLGLVNDSGHKVIFFLDEDLLKEEKIYVHPDTNTATLEIGIEDFKKFITSTQHALNMFVV